MEVEKNSRDRVTISHIRNERRPQDASNRVLDMLRREKLSTQELSSLLCIPCEDVSQSIDELIARRYNIKLSDGLYSLDTGIVENARQVLIPYYEDVFRFGIVSDTHQSSTCEQLTNLNVIYDIFDAHGISTVLHPGDLNAGEGVYKGQQYEVTNLGADNQRAWCIKNYPHRKGIKTYVIAGNHDASYMTRCAHNIVEAVCDERDDMIYCGMMAGQITLDNGLMIELLHPDGGVPYARSYRSQKINEARGRGEDVPDITIYGHMHVTGFLPYLGVYDILAGCFEGQTTYEKRKGLNPDIGGWIIEVGVKKGTKIINRLHQSWYPFEDIKDDWKNYL